MKLQYLMCWILVLNSIPAWAQTSAEATQTRSLGYRSASTIPDNELKEIYISKINGKQLSRDQIISYNLIDQNFQKLTQTLFQFYQSHSSADIVSLWQENNHAWLKEDQFGMHPYYRALYCLYIHKPYIRPNTPNAQLASDLKSFLGCQALVEELRVRLPQFADLIQSNWNVVIDTTETK